MKRSTAILLLAGWLAVVTWYWRENVPLVPTKTVDLPPDRTVAMLSPTGELVVSSYQSLSRTAKSTGPFEFWSFPEIRRVRQELRTTDEIVVRPNYRTGDILIRCDGELQLYNLYSGRVLSTLPDLDDVREFRIVPNREQVLIQTKRDLHLFAFNRSEPVWTANEVWLGDDLVGDHLIVRCRDRKSPQLLEATVVLLSTGGFDHRFDQAERVVRRIELSSDGRWALVFPQKGRPLVCDAATGKALWPLPADPAVDWWFTDVGDVVYGHRTSDDQSLVRLRASDGAPLAPLMGQQFRLQQRRVTADGRFAHVAANSGPPRIIGQWINQATYLPTSWRDRLYALLHRHRSKVIDHQTERLIGHFPDYVRPFVLKDNLGFATFTPGRIDYYALPPRRNWSWLARWALLPPAIVVLLARVWPRVRSRKQRRVTRSVSSALMISEDVQR